jgi:hypothetical protein
MSGEFNLLGIDLKALVDDFDPRYSVYAYVVVIIMSAVFIPAGFLEGFSKVPDPSFARILSIALVVTEVLSIPLSAIAMFGFVCLGVRWNSRFLAYSTLAILAVGVAYSAIPIANEILYITSSVTNMAFEYFALITGAVVDGASGIIFGAALIRSKKGHLINAAGYLNVINGLFYISIFLAPMGVLLSVPLMCLEAYVLYKEGKPGQMKTNEKSPLKIPSTETVRVMP